MPPGSDEESLDRAVRLLFRNARDYRVPLNPSWPAADWSSCPQAHVLLDGWMSTGDDTTHLYAIHSDTLGQGARWMAEFLRAYSYTGPSQVYGPRDTNGNLRAHLRAFQAALSKFDPEAPLAITAYSLGAAIALISLRRYFAQHPHPRPFRLTLIAPAISGTPGLFDALRDPSSALYKEFRAADALFGGDEPALLLALGQRDAWGVREARAAAHDLAAIGGLSIRFIEGDLFAPHEQFHIADIDEQPCDDDDLVRRSDLALAHIRARTSRPLHIEAQILAAGVLIQP